MFVKINNKDHVIHVLEDSSAHIEWPSDQPTVKDNYGNQDWNRGTDKEVGDDDDDGGDIGDDGGEAGEWEEEENEV